MGCFSVTFLGNAWGTDLMIVEQPNFEHFPAIFYSITSCAALFSSVENFPHSKTWLAVLFSIVEKSPLTVEKYPSQTALAWNISNYKQFLLECFRISICCCWKIFDAKKWCRKFSVEDCTVEKFPSRTVEKFPALTDWVVEKFLSKKVCFPGCFSPQCFMSWRDIFENECKCCIYLSPP